MCTFWGWWVAICGKIKDKLCVNLDPYKMHTADEFYDFW